MAAEQWMVELAKEAIEMGRTRGQFIRENSTLRDCRDYLQQLSDAYTVAMSQSE